jgi:hypothetical protein
MKKIMQYLLRSVAGALCISWVIFINRQSADLMSLGAAIVILPIAFYQFILFGLSVLTLANEPSPWIEKFLDRGIVRTVKGIYAMKLSMRRRYWLLLGGWGILIYLFLMFLEVTNVFDKKETLFLRLRWMENTLGKQIFGRYQGIDGYNRYLKEEPVRYFILSSVDNNNFKYVNDIYTIAKDLKAAGAKAVVADAPGWPYSTPQQHFIPPGLFPGDTSTAVLRNIASLDIVIWVNRTSKNPFARYSREPVIRLHTPGSDRSANAPKYDFVYSVERDASSPYGELKFQPIFRWHPVTKYQIYHGSYSYDLDVAIAAAQKFLGISDTSVLTNDGHALHLQDLTIPLSSDGTAFSSIHLILPTPVSATRGYTRWGQRENKPDRVWYHEWLQPIAIAQNFLDADTLQNLMKYKDFFAGKVVVVEWMNNVDPQETLANVKTANIISSVIRNTSYKKIDSITTTLVILSILLLAVFSANVRIRWTLCVAVLLIAGIIGFAIWIFFSLRVMFDPVYPILATVLAFIIFSLIKITLESDAAV